MNRSVHRHAVVNKGQPMLMSSSKQKYEQKSSQTSTGKTGVFLANEFIWTINYEQKCPEGTAVPLVHTDCCYTALCGDVTEGTAEPLVHTDCCYTALCSDVTEGTAVPLVQHKLLSYSSSVQHSK